jgi:superfamily II DNA/RNA helicase
VVIFDEAHTIKNAKSARAEAANKLCCRRRFGLTGTLMQNNMMEMYCTLDWAAPGALGPASEFKEYYQTPIGMGQKINANPSQLSLAKERAQGLNNLVRSHVLARDKGMIKDQIPGKDDYIVICPMTDEQRVVYDRVLASDDYALLRKNSEPCCGMKDGGKVLLRKKCCFEMVKQGDLNLFLVDPRHADERGYIKWFRFMLPAITQLLKICNHLDLVRVAQNEEYAGGGGGEDRKMKDTLFAMYAFETDQMHLLKQSSNISVQANDEHCGKMKVLKGLLSTWYTDGDKVLLFSYSVRMLNILEKLLIAEGHAYQRLDGSTPPSQRLAACERFNRTNETFVFLISTRAGGLGLNLTAANKVVVFDPNWNPSYDIQAQDRAFRIGQRRHVSVYRLISGDSLEETIYQRQIYKQQSANIVMNAAHERRYFKGVQGLKGEEGELFGLTNLLSARKTTEILDRQKKSQNHFQMKLTQIEAGGAPPEGDVVKGKKGIKRKRDRGENEDDEEAEAGAAGGAGEGDGDDDESWQLAAQELISEEAEEEDAEGHKGGKGGEEEGRGEGKRKAADLSVENLLKTLVVHQHKDIVGASDREMQVAARVQKIYGNSKEDASGEAVVGVEGERGGTKMARKQPPGGADGGGGARTGRGGGKTEVKHQLTSEEKKKAAQELMERNCKERLKLSWEEFLSKYKQSSAAEKKALYDQIK